VRSRGSTTDTGCSQTVPNGEKVEPVLQVFTFESQVTDEPLL